MKTVNRSGVRSFLVAAICATAVPQGGLHAQPYPSRPIEFNVHTSPGGGTDLFARTVTEILIKEKAFPQPIIVSNRPGGSGAIAFNHVKGKRGDPHVVLTMATGSFLTATVRKELDLGLEHFTPLVSFAVDPQVIAVSVDSKFKTVKELIDAGRKRAEHHHRQHHLGHRHRPPAAVHHRARDRREVQVRLVQERQRGDDRGGRRTHPVHAREPERDAGTRRRQEAEGAGGDRRQAPARRAGRADHEGAGLQGGRRHRARFRHARRRAEGSATRPWKPR